MIKHHIMNEAIKVAYIHEEIGIYLISHIKKKQKLKLQLQQKLHKLRHSLFNEA